MADDDDIRRKPRRLPGRPRDENASDVRESLLDAAAQRFAEAGYAGASLRSIADHAQVTPAMVHYYFGTKEGLYQALLERSFARLLPQVSATASDDQTIESTAAQLLALGHERLLGQPWIAPLLLREVLSDGGSFRDRFVELFASRAAERLVAAFAAGIEGGELRPDLDPRLAYISFVSLLLFPVLARPVLEGALDQSFDDSDWKALREHTCQLFLDGARRSTAPSQPPAETAP